MLAELAAIVERASGAARETLDADLRSTARMLLERQFVFADDFQGARRYEMVRKHRDYFASLFDALGFDLVLDEREQLAGLTSQAGIASRRMSVDETLFLVALRVVYETRVKEFMLREGGRADSTMSEVWDLVEERTRRPRPSPARCRTLAEGFARNGLVRLMDPLPDGDIQLEIRPAVAKAVTVATAESLERYGTGAGMSGNLGEDGGMADEDPGTDGDGAVDGMEEEDTEE